MAAPALAPALTAPQYAESLPIPSFRWIAVRLEIANARYSFSLLLFSSMAYSTTGTHTVIPWFPLPELMMTGSSHPPILASEAAAALARARVCTSSPWFNRTFPILAP